MLSPSREERTVASALLLLSKTIPHQSPMSIKQRISSSCSKSEEESFSSKSHSVSSSTLTSLHGSSSRGNRPSHKLRIVAVVSRSHDTKFKVVRKKRSKVSWTSYDDPRKIVLALPAAASFKSDSSTEEVSCITSTISSAASTASSMFLFLNSLNGASRGFVRSHSTKKHGQSPLNSAVKVMRRIINA
eukprot:XP_025015374.1 uncharacterized protein LOC8286303 [Ricinus communis]